MFLSTVYFFAIIVLLGVPVVWLVRGRLRLSFEEWVAATGLGLAAFVVLGLLLNVTHLPLTWWMFLVAGAVLAAAGVVRCRRRADTAEPDAPKPPFWCEGNVCLLIALGFTVVTFGVFLNGTYQSDWLPDDDSWEHAASAKYIALHHTYSIDPEARAYPVQSYLEPYPPGYPVLMGVLHQVNPSIYDTLKFFNVLLIALGIVYFYLAVKEWTGSARIGAWSAGMLWVTPCFMSHFIWAQTLALVLFFPAFYAFARIRREPVWAIPAALAIGAMLITQPSAAAICGLFIAIAWLVRLGFTLAGKSGEGRGGERLDEAEGSRWRTLGWQLAAGVAALALAATFYLPAYAKFGKEGFDWGVMRRLPKQEAGFTGTSHGVAYGPGDFLWSPYSNKINQPTGFGPVLAVAALAGIIVILARFIFDIATGTSWRRHSWRLAALAWLVLGVVGVEGNALLPAKWVLFPHRFWAFLAIPVAIVAGEAFAWLTQKMKWNTALLTAALGLSLGLALVFGTVAEHLYREFDKAAAFEIKPESLSMTDVRLGLFLVSALAAAAALAAAVVRLVKQRSSAGTAFSFIAAAVLTAGIIVTSGYSKARFEGFSPWPGGVFFYASRVHDVNGRLVVVLRDGLGRVVGQRAVTPEELNALAASGQSFSAIPDLPQSQDLRGYIQIRRTFPANTPIFSVTGMDEHLVGFDMLTPPYDRDLQTFREEEVWSKSAAEMTPEVVRRLHAKARERGFDYVLLSPYQAAQAKFYAGGTLRRLGSFIQDGPLPGARVFALTCRDPRMQYYMRVIGFTREQIGRLIQMNASPEGIESEALERVNALLGDLAKYRDESTDSLDKVQRLRELMIASPDLFNPVFAHKSQPEGISLFEVK